jgi:hypothetical protein
MRRDKIMGPLAAVATGLVISAAALADPGNLPPPGSTSVFSQMMGRRVAPTSDDDAKKDDSKKAADKKAAKKPAPTKPSEDPIARARAQELANCLRRQEVCLKLMQIAEASNDDALLRKAQELDQRAEAAYQRRIGELSGAAADQALLNKPSESKKTHSASLFPFLHGGSTAKEGTPQ